MHQTLFVQSVVPITIFIVIILALILILSVIVPNKVPTIILVRGGALVEFERIVGHPRHIVGLLLIVVVIVDATCHGEQTFTDDGVGRDAAR